MAHDWRADPHPSHDTCPALNQIGLIGPGQTATSGPLLDVGPCGLHDELQPLTSVLHVRIEVR